MAAFKVTVNENTYERMFDGDLWPTNVIIRPYRYRNFRRAPPAALQT